MENDDLFAALGRDWRQRPVDVDAIAVRFARNRHERRRLMAATGVGALLVLLTLLWFAWEAITGRDPATIIAATAFAAALPFLLVGFWRLGRQSTRYDALTPFGLLVATRDRLQVSRSMLWGPRWSARILVASVAALWISAALGEVAAREIPLPTVAWLATAALIWRWQQRRAERATGEIARCDALIADYRDPLKDS